MRRGAERFRELMRRSRWIRPMEPIDPDVREEILRGAARSVVGAHQVKALSRSG